MKNCKQQITVRALGRAYLRRILAMHMSAASLRTMSSAGTPATARRMRRYLSLA
jgi:hypothetical protein